VTYKPTWEPIGDALDRIAAAGNPKTQAKSDLCLAISDRKITVRLHVISPPSLGSRKQLLESPMLDVPRKLVPSDIDWRRSRPANPADLWIDVSRRPGEFNMIHLERFRPFMGSIAELIEVRVADVVGIFCNPCDVAKQPDPILAEQHPNRTFNRCAKRDRIMEFARKKWPDGIPEDVTAKECYRVIEEGLRDNGHPVPSKRTLQRALSLVRASRQ
jgi:hypothetical protein